MGLEKGIQKSFNKSLAAGIFLEWFKSLSHASNFTNTSSLDKALYKLQTIKLIEPAGEVRPTP